MTKIFEKRNLVLIIGAIIALIPWVLYLFLGNGEDKLLMLVLSLVLPLIIYGFIRLLCKIVRPHAPASALKIGAYFLMIVGAIGALLSLVAFVTEFPGGFSPGITVCFALALAALDEAKKTETV